MIHHIKDIIEGLFLSGVIVGVILTLIFGWIVHTVRKHVFKKENVQS